MNEGPQKASEEYQLTKKKTGKNKLNRPSNEVWMGLDLSSQGIKNISMTLFDMSFIKELYLSNNEIEVIPAAIVQLKELEVLNLSKNKIKNIPAVLGKLVSLKELYLNDNLISTVPMRLGGLYNLEVFDISNNPLIIPFNLLNSDKKLLHYCREHNTQYPMPNDRLWVDTKTKGPVLGDTISVATFNILCNFYASKLSYAPSWVLNPEFRKENILHEVVSYNVDILCLQEIEMYAYLDFYKEQLELRCDYDSFFCPKSRAKSMNERRSVDGCAIFWKRNKHRMLDNLVLEFNQKITQDPRFKDNLELQNRNSKKDNIAVFVVLERFPGQLLIIVNVHIYWDPDYPDVKLLQTLILLEEIEKIKEKYKAASVILLGDFNSLKDSTVYRTITGRTADLGDFIEYEKSPFPKGFTNTLNLSDAYKDQDLDFTNFTPKFKDVLDYIFYGEDLILTSVLSPVENEYTDNTVEYSLPFRPHFDRGKVPHKLQFSTWI